MTLLKAVAGTNIIQSKLSTFFWKQTETAELLYHCVMFMFIKLFRCYQLVRCKQPTYSLKQKSFRSFSDHHYCTFKAIVLFEQSLPLLFLFPALLTVSSDMVQHTHNVKTYCNQTSTRELYTRVT